jgi:thiamine pyrophosphokinase
MMRKSSDALIFANGAVHDGACVHNAIYFADKPLVICADGGARTAYHHFRLMPDIILGDLDSLTREEVAFYRGSGVVIEKYPVHKDETDLEIALKWAVKHGVKHIWIVGALGRRIDQTFGNIYLLALEELNEVDVWIVSGKQIIWLARPGNHFIYGQAGDTVSLIPISGDVTNIHTQNLYYPLTGDTLHYGPARGISNVLTSERGEVRFDTGQLLIVRTLGKAD